MLKMTGIELEVISDIDMHLFIERGMRGGISYISKRYNKANNKYMKDYDNTKETIYDMYLDKNNLYALAMIQYLPYGGFKWLSSKEINKFECNSTDLDLIEKDSSVGYTLEVDLEYPSDDYPLAPEKLKVNNYILSKYSLNIAMNMR